jgi:hypothetical protein
MGAIIFWNLMDTDKCSKEVYNYVFISLIIKFVTTIYEIIKNNDN